MRSKYDYRRTFCAVCGMPGSYLSSEGWWTCSEHFRAAKPERRVFDHVTGEPLPQPDPEPAIELPEERPSDLILPKPCLSYRPGHRVHWIQGLHSVNKGEDANHVRCSITEVDDDGWFTLVLLDTGERKRRWHHSVPALHERADLHLRVHERYWIIRKVSGPSNPISIYDKPTPCVFEEPTGPLHERLETHGGFSIPGPEALRLIAESAEQAED